MTDDDDPVSSPAQDDYANAAAACRQRLMVVGMEILPRCNAHETHCLVSALQACFWFEVLASSFDKKKKHNEECTGH